MAKKKQTQPQYSNAVIYARYSSHAQNEASIEQQVDKCTEFASRSNFNIVAVYQDKAMSGTNDRRPDFQHMMKDAQKGAFQYVIAWKSNRMGRNMLEAMMNDAKLMECGVRCLYVEEDFGDSAAGRFALRNMMNVNQFYSENMAEDITRGLYDNARQCKTNGALPLGYKRGQDGRYEIDAFGADIVREIYRRYASGDTLASIADDLNGRCIKTARGSRWNKNSFHTLLSNERYIGIYKYGDVRIEGGVPAIIDNDLFETVSKKLRRRGDVKGRRRDGNEYLLTGKLYCGKCLAPMTGVSGTGKLGESYGYYVCNKRKTEHACDKEYVGKEYAETLVAEALVKYVLNDDAIEWIADGVMKVQRDMMAESDIPYYEDKLAEVRKSIDNFMDAIASGFKSETIKRRIADLEAEERRLNENIRHEKAKMLNVTRDQVLFFLDSFRHGDISSDKYRKQLFDSFLVAAYLYDDHIKIIFNYDGSDCSKELPICVDNVEGKSSFNASCAPPKEAETNTKATIDRVGKVFVLAVYFNTSHQRRDTQ